MSVPFQIMNVLSVSVYYSSFPSVFLLLRGRLPLFCDVCATQWSSSPPSSVSQHDSDWLPSHSLCTFHSVSITLHSSPVIIKILFKTPKWAQFLTIYNATLQLFNNAYFENDICGRKSSICLADGHLLYLFASLALWPVPGLVLLRNLEYEFLIFFHFFFKVAPADNKRPSTYVMRFNCPCVTRTIVHSLYYLIA